MINKIFLKLPRPPIKIRTHTFKNTRAYTHTHTIKRTVYN